MLRDLHPAHELSSYQTVWHGASFRNYDFTPAPLPNHAALNEPACVRVFPLQEQMRQWLSEIPRTAHEAATALGLRYSSAQHILQRLVRDRSVVRTSTPGGYRGRQIVRYQRAR